MNGALTRNACMIKSLKKKKKKEIDINFSQDHYCPLWGCYINMAAEL